MVCCSFFEQDALCARGTVAEHTIFLCWQSDNSTARNAVRSSLYKAVKAVEREIGGQVAVDEDNRAYAGSPHIDHVIRERIRRASAMVADLSLVGDIVDPSTPDVVKKTPNPNVMFEVGYAFATIGPERIVLVRDKRLVGELPFDINHHRYTEFDRPAKLKEALIEALLAILRQPAGLPGSEAQRSIVLRCIAHGLPSGRTQRSELATELYILAESEDDVWFQLSQYLRADSVPPRDPSWKPYFNASSGPELAKDIRVLLNSATNGDKRVEAQARVQEFLASEEISLARRQMMSSLRPLKGGNASAIDTARVQRILQAVTGAEELGLSPADLRAACEAFNSTPADKNRVRRCLTEFIKQFTSLGDPLEQS